MKTKPGKITIKVAQFGATEIAEERQIDAEIAGDWAIHPEIGGFVPAWWTVTHIPTGRSLVTTRYKTTATRALEMAQAVALPADPAVALPVASELAWRIVVALEDERHPIRRW